MLQLKGKPLISAIMVFIVVAFLTQFLSYQQYLIHEDAEQKEILDEANLIKDRLKTSLSYSLSATKTLAYLVESYGVPADFDRVAREILESNKFIDALELTHGGVITHVYPLKGNEKAIGFDVLLDSVSRKEAYKAIEKKELYFAGPLELRQGGKAVIGRLPIFINGKFQGFSVVLIKFSTLLKASGIDTTGNEKFKVQLSKINPITKREEFFLGSASPDQKLHPVAVDVPDGEWKLYVMPKNEDGPLLNVVIFSLLGLLFSFGAGFLTWFLVRQPVKLNKLVAEKTFLLESSEKYFRALIEKSSEAIVLTDGSGKVIYQSPATEKISGFSLAEMQAMDGLDRIHPEDRPEEKTMFENLVQLPGTTLKRNHRFQHKDGHYIWLEGTYTNLLADVNVKAIVYNYHDITARRQTEEEINRSRSRLTAILENTSDFIWSIDKEYKLLFCNTHFEKFVKQLTGNKIKVGNDIRDFMPADAEKEILALLDRAIKGEQFTTEQERSFNGNTIILEYFFNPILNENNEVTGIATFMRNITERKKVEQEIEQEKNLSASIINSLPGVFYLYDKTGKFFRWNKNFEFITGYSNEQIAKMHPLEFIAEEERELVGMKIKEVFEKGKADVSVNALRINNEKIPFHFTGHHIILHGVDYLIGTGLDITARVKTENELMERTREIQKLTAHLEEIREEERTRISREIHDELGQQLTGLKMDISWIAKRIHAGETQLDAKIEAMISLIDLTIKSVRRIASELRPGILDDLGLMSALEWQGQEFEKRTGIKSEFHGKLDNFNPERNMSTNIFRIYQEGLTNIIRHSEATKIETTIEKKDGYIWLTIKDNGHGFDIEETKGNKTLGLLGMRERALLFKGTLTIESEKMKGTIISLQIPVTG